MPETQPGLGHTLAVLENAELVRQLAALELEYQFKHALVQDTVYQSLLKNERRELHLAAARALEASYPGSLDENAARLVEHYQEADDVENTILFATRAGERAMQFYAHPEARHFFGIALNLMMQREPTTENTRALLDLAVQYFFVSWARIAADRDLEQLRALAERARALADGPEGNTQDRVRAMRLVAESGNALFARNQEVSALECYQEVLARADAGTYDAASIANAAINTAGVLTVQGHFNQAEPLARQGYDIGKEMPLMWYWYGGLTFASLACAMRGNPRQALRDLKHGLDEADAAANLPAAAALSIGLATVCRVTLDWHQLLELGDDAYARAARARDYIYQHVALSLSAQAASELRERERARALLAQSRTIFEASQGNLFFADWTLVTYAIVLFNLGDVEQARAQVEHLLAMAPGWGSLFSPGLAHRLHAQILARTNPEEIAAIDADMKASLAYLEQGDAQLESAHTNVAWAHILLRRGEHAAARDLRERAARVYRHAGLNTLAEDAEKYD